MINAFYQRMMGKKRHIFYLPSRERSGSFTDTNTIVSVTLVFGILPSDSVTAHVVLQ